MAADAAQIRAGIYQQLKAELTAYLARLVLREEVAAGLAQQTAVRMLESSRVPNTQETLRPWLFRVATNLAIDYLRRHSTKRERILDDTRKRAEGDAAFVQESQRLAGSPEMKSIAREHLAVCFVCTLRNLRPEESAALLLKEVYDFSVEETARVMDAGFGQVKNWLQSARAKLKGRYEKTCALVTQQGECYQCVELDEFFESKQGDPLRKTRRDIDARMGSYVSSVPCHWANGTSR